MNNGPEAIIHSDRLVEACKHNDRKAQVKLYELYSKTMYNTSLRIVQDTMLAEDVVQESFLKAFMSLSQFRREVPFSIWLRRIVINKSLDELRKQKTEFSPIDEEMVVEDTEQDIISMNREITMEKLTILKQAVNQLADGYRIIFSLFYFEGYDHDEIAHIMQISPSTSRSQLTRARQKIVHRLKKTNV